MKNSIKNSLLIIALIGLFASCVNDSFDTPVQEVCRNPDLTKTKTIAAIYASATAITQTYTINDIIEGYVISSDEGGNFYKSMYFQSLDGSKGFNLSIDEVNVYTKNLQPGKKVFLKLKGLAYANPISFARGLVFGATPTDIYAVDRLSGLVYSDYLIASCDIVSEDAIVHKITLDQASSDTFLNTLVEFDNVEFVGESIGGTYDINRHDSYDSSIYVENGRASLAVRTSRFANFAGYLVPVGSGKIRGVLTKYNSIYQIILRSERDVKMNNLWVDYHLALVGNSLTYRTTFTENFSSYIATTTGANFPKYINDAYVGSRYWDVKSFGSNKYIQMSSFNSGGKNKTYLVMPVAFTPGKKLSFKTKDGFYNGAVLKVYYSKNYVPGNDISKATLVDISSSFAISNGTINGYASKFKLSGNYLIPANLTGNGFFIFEYSGNESTTLTTTIQIDDITVN